MSTDTKKSHKLSRLFTSIVTAIVITCLVIVAGVVYKLFFDTNFELTKVLAPESSIIFDTSVSETEKATIITAVEAAPKTKGDSITAKINNTLSLSTPGVAVETYVPVTSTNAARQSIMFPEFKDLNVLIAKDTEDIVKQALAATLTIDVSAIGVWEGTAEQLDETTIAFLPVRDLTSELKLLNIDGAFYLDSFKGGAFFREVVFEGEIGDVIGLKFGNQFSKEDVLSVNQTGVTALTRLMMRKLNTVKDPLYFSENIGDFLANSDITHVSNEVSFKKGCTYSDTLFCSPPEMIEVLKDSGVDVVELTGNHNNDVGSQYNTESIELYKSLGWQTIGGGLNSTEAAKFYVADQKGSKVAMLAYNFPDSPNGGAIATATKAGANSFDFDKIKADIESAKQQSDFVIVNVQFWECYAYPEGYSEFPECDKPIGTQAETFKKIVDLGANMVVGTSAHQPQTYEIYNGSPIYYGLGNLYFDQDRWPGTERGIILTHYFHEGKLLQTKLTPTVYDGDYQTRIMTSDESAYLLGRLKAAR